MDNRRQAQRVEFVKFAHLLSTDGTILHECQVRNLSSRGARLILSELADLPDDVLLCLPLDGVTWPCRIMRRRGREIGIEFT